MATPVFSKLTQTVSDDIKGEVQPLVDEANLTLSIIQNLLPGAMYDTTADGVNPTTGVASGQFFVTWQDNRLRIYLNNSGTAVLKSELSTIAQNDVKYAQLSDLSSTAAGKGTSLIKIKENQVGAIDEALFTKLINMGMKTPQSFGARGPGYIDTGPINDWLKALASTKGGLMLPMEYSIDAPIDLTSIDLEGVTVFGRKGKSVIKGVNGTGAKLIDFGNVNGLTIEGISFINQHVLSYSTLESFKGLLHFQNKNVKNLIIRDNYFSSPSSVQHHIFIAVATSELVTPKNASGVYILDNEFNQSGGQGITFMNRSYNQSDPYQYFREVYVYRNKAMNLGLAQAYAGGGQFISLDGYGRDFAIGHNHLYNLFSQGIENTGWQNGIVHDNKGENFSRGWALLTYSGRGAGDPLDTKHPLINTHSRRNVTVGTATGALASTYAAMDDTCSIEDDFIVADTSTYAANFRENSKLEVRTSSFININAAADNAVNIDGYQAGNQDMDFLDCTFGASQSTGGVNVIQFSGSGTVRNKIRGSNTRILKGSSGGYIGQGSSAAGNIVEPFFDETGNRRNAVLTISTSSDADHVVSAGSSAQAADYILLSGGVSWTAERSLDFPTVELFRKPCLFRHTKEWPCTIKINGTLVAASRVNPNQTVMLLVNNSGTLIVTPLTNGFLEGSLIYDAPSIAAGAVVTTTVSVNGAALGDYTTVSLSVTNPSLMLSADVTANNVVTVKIFNPTVSPVDLASATLKARVWK